MTRMIIGIALVLVACAHEQQRSGVTTTSVTIPPAPATTPQTAPEPQSRKADASGISMDVQTDLGTTTDGRISDSIYAGILADMKLSLAAQQSDITTRDGYVVLSGRVR